MSNSKMLIDATHPEETRVVVQRNGRVEEFDFESAARKLLRGNIYLAKVTRVEPSLQAAFVDYGGNRHGFLAFNEIHPDYYQIPVADRQALIDEEAAAEAELEAAADRRAEALERRSRQRGHRADELPAEQPAVEGEGAGGSSDETEPAGEISNIVDVEEDEHIEEIGGENGDDDVPQTFAAAHSLRDESISEATSGSHESGDAQAISNAAPQEQGPAADVGEPSDIDPETGHDVSPEERDGGEGSEADEPDIETAAGEPSRRRRGGDFEEVPVRQRRRPRSYKIQEVIKRRQVILVQVVKEERGNKGAALTTYLSLAGRYTVLMPNTARGGGISRKISNPQDRKRLKAIAQELDVPEGMGLIIRTAGAARTKQEIKRDFEYLLRLWESVRDLTLQSTAPSLVYEEGDLIKRSIRDLYNKDVEEVVVAGDAGYREAADFMHMLLPSHSKNVIQYNEPAPLFARYGVERQLNAMFSPQVTLRSGGYIVINQTEALVAIDVNSGKSTREFSIEETALATNLEAADEIARQLKLRDLAGLIVIDFIDMEEKRNNRAVERRLKDALRHDRARIQLGRISHFGLMEMSRQRLRTGVLEGSTSQCQHCQGTGIIRSTESVALAVLRGLEDSITAGATAPLVATTTSTVALYILNSKRAYITDMEARHGFPVTIMGSDRIHGANFTIERGQAAAQPVRRTERAAVNMDWGFDGESAEEAPGFESGTVEEIEHAAEDQADALAPRHPARDARDSEGGEDDAARRGRRRRRRRGGRRDRGDEGPRSGGYQASHAGSDEHGEETEGASSIEENSDEPETTEAAHADQPDHIGYSDSAEHRRRRRRGRRGGRRGRENGGRDQQGHNEHGDHAHASESGGGPQLPGYEPQPDAAFDVPGGKTARDPSDRSIESARPRRSRERIWDVSTSTAPAGGELAAASGETEQPDRTHRGGHNGEKSPELSSVAPASSEPTANDAKPDAPADPVRRRHELDSSEPRLERVVVRPGHEGEGSASSEPAPQRKGWWQRRFGSE